MEADRVHPMRDKNVVKVNADNPIRKPEDDVLGRMRVAGSFAEQLQSL